MNFGPNLELNNVKLKISGMARLYIRFNVPKVLSPPMCASIKKRAKSKKKGQFSQNELGLCIIAVSKPFNPLHYFVYPWMVRQVTWLYMHILYLKLPVRLFFSPIQIIDTNLYAKSSVSILKSYTLCPPYPTICK